LNDRSNVAGAGINIAQRVMDCGDAGHILLSNRIAEDLAQYERWQPHLHDLGEATVKHGVNVHVFNLCADGIGNPEIPSKVRQQREAELVAARKARAKTLRKLAVTISSYDTMKYSLTKIEAMPGQRQSLLN
jgi:hypothetical protein